MFDYSLAFDDPKWLSLLALLPAIWVIGQKSLAGLDLFRRFTALALRSLVAALVILALAGTQYRQKSDRVTVVYLLDQSLSISDSHRDAMRRFVNASIRENRRDDQEDRAGVIVFGRDAEVELPPVDFTYEMAKVESLVERNYTNLAGSLRKAMSLFPHDSAKRVVVVTDGNENIGNALRQARAMADAGISIDVLPVPLVARGEVTVDKVVLPADVRRGQPFELRAVLDHQASPESPNAAIGGLLRIIRKSGEREETISENPVELQPGKNLFSLNETIDRPDFYTYEARFVPESAASDSTAQNNVATAFTHVRGRGHVLLIEDYEFPGEFDHLVHRLRSEGLEVTIQPSNLLFTSLAELQRYDTVILANVPRSSGFSPDAGGGVDSNRIAGFSDSQIDILVANTEELGCGLIMLGGDRSFGTGGWINTKLEEAMPLDFRIKAAKVMPVGALAMIMHASEFAQGNFWQKVIAREAVRTLGPSDYCGLIQWNGADQWLWNHPKGMLPVGPNSQKMMARIDRLTVGDMPQFDPGMMRVALAMAALKNPTPAIKHCIIISDGDPSRPSNATIQAFIKQKIKITTVAVGALGGHGDLQMMQSIANKTGGKYYLVRSAKALPRIYQREARRIAQPLVRELAPPVAPQVVIDHDILRGIEGSPPPISGFVQTTTKENSLVEVVLRSPLPPNPKNSAILATWTYGLGKTAALTTDAGKRWANSWAGWQDYDRFFSQLVRWSMRPTGDTGAYSLATEVKDGQTRVIIDALDKNEEFINVQTMTGTAVGPDMTSTPVMIEQVAPGRYVGAFDSEASGSYLLVIQPGPGQPLIRAGVNVGYSDEFRDRETNRPLLQTLAQLETRNGEPGKVIDEEAGVPLPASGEIPDPLLRVNPYRRDLPPAIASQDIWPLLVLLSSCVFLADVFVRRVQFDFEWARPLLAWFSIHLLRRQPKEKSPETISRLQSRKRELRQASESRSAEARFEYDESAPLEGSASATFITPKKFTTKRPPSEDVAAEQSTEEESYLDRLKKAKQEAQRKRDQNP